MTPDRAIALLDPEHTFAFLRTPTTTACNSFAKCVCACMSVYLPPTTANEQHDYLVATPMEWTPLEADEAATTASFNGLVLASWKNETGGHGHIAVLRSSSRTGALRVGAAGLRNFADAPLEDSFGLAITPQYFAHRST